MLVGTEFTQGASGKIKFVNRTVGEVGGEISGRLLTVVADASDIEGATGAGKNEGTGIEDLASGFLDGGAENPEVVNSQGFV